jgi:hypothetical protein
MRKGMFFLVMSLLLFPVLPTFSQSRWVHTYHENIDSPIHFITESYDNGYLLVGKYGANYSKYNWLIKTNINGEILWEKTIGDGMNAIALSDIKQDYSGNIYLGGINSSYDPEGDPLIIKLDSCGEKQWCRIFYTENNLDFTRSMILTTDRCIAAVLSYTNPVPHKDRICLAKLSPDGEQLWKHCFTSVDTHQRDEESYDLILTPDNGFLITGFCYYEDPTEPNHWIPHPYFLKTDFLGNFEWETVVFKETNLDGGGAWSTVVSPDSMFYFSSISHYRYDLNQSLPAIVKMDMQGNVLDVYDVVDGTKYGVLAYAQFINDSTLAASAGWGNNTDSLWSRAVLIDTLGHLLNNTVLLQNDYTSYLQVTYDGKLVYASNDYQNGKFDCYLTKLNQDLEQDTFYTRPFTYNSLCPYQIVSDTIVQDDCGVIVGMEEQGGGEAGKQGSAEACGHGGILLWPNPASSEIHGRLNMDDGRFNKDLTLVVYDIFGRAAPGPSPTWWKGEQSSWTVDVSTLPPGIYLGVIKEGQIIKASAKFVVAR